MCNHSLWSYDSRLLARTPMPTIVVENHMSPKAIENKTPLEIDRTYMLGTALEWSYFEFAVLLLLVEELPRQNFCFQVYNWSFVHQIFIQNSSWGTSEFPQNVPSPTTLPQTGKELLGQDNSSAGGARLSENLARALSQWTEAIHCGVDNFWADTKFRQTNLSTVAYG